MTEKRPKHRRPIWVWLISVFYFGFGASGIMAVGMALVLFFRGSVPPEQLPVLNTMLQSSLWGLLPAVSVAGALSLFFMKKIAFPIFTGLLAIRTALPAIFAAHPDYGFSKSTAEMIAGYALGYGILLGVCIYAYHLRKTGQLR